MFECIRCFLFFLGGGEGRAVKVYRGYVSMSDIQTHGRLSRGGSCAGERTNSKLCACMLWFLFSISLDNQENCPLIFGSDHDLFYSSNIIPRIVQVAKPHTCHITIVMPSESLIGIFQDISVHHMAEHEYARGCPSHYYLGKASQLRMSYQS